MTSSRVPDTRPGRPIAVCDSSRSTVRRIRRTVLNAAGGLSLAMCSNWASRSASAARSHLTRTLRPLLEHFLYFLVGGEVSRIGLLYCLLDLFNLPFVDGHVLPDGFRRQERTAALGGLSQFVELLFELTIYPESQN